MKILKYTFLFLLLSLVAVAVFLATQKGEFVVERSKVISASKMAVYSYVNDIKNHSDFESWAVEDGSLHFKYGSKTVGKGANFSWTGPDSEGQASLGGGVDNESIRENLELNGSSYNVSWVLKDTLQGKVKLSWKAKGRMSFLFKIYTAVNGGADNIIGTMAEKTLSNIDKKLNLDVTTYAIKVNGIVKVPETYYIKQTFTSELKKIHRNAAVVIPHLIEFSKTNQLHIDAKPFIIYHPYDLARGLAKISICLPIGKEIMTSTGSDILSGKLNAFDGVKATLTGSYAYLNNAYEQTSSFFTKENLAVDPSWSHLEILQISTLDQKEISKLQTEVIYPIREKSVVVQKVPVPVNNGVEAPEKEEITPKRAPVKRTETPSPQKPQEEVGSEFEL